MFTALVAGAAGASTTELDGSDISRLIVDKLASQGLKAAPSIKPNRLFPACDSKPEIEPMFDGGRRWPFAVQLGQDGAL